MSYPQSMAPAFPIIMPPDDTLISILESVTFVWLLAWAIQGTRRLLSRRRDSIWFLVITHFVFCGVPLLLDQVVGPPDFHLWPGFDIAAADPQTAVVYCLYVAACPLIWWLLGRTRVRTSPSQNSLSTTFLQRLSWPGKTALHFLLLAPVAALYFAPDPTIYAQYAAVMRAPFTPDELSYHQILTTAILIGTMAQAVLLLSQRNLRATCCYVLPLAFCGVWLDGKRAVVLIVCVTLTIALWSRGVLRGRTLIAFAAAVSIAFCAFSAVYQLQIRGFDSVPTESRYDNFRLDYGRDHIIRASLFAELHPEDARILEYRMQSVLFDATMLVPRSIWPDKPWPYAVYATAAAFRIPPQYLGWGVTTTWLAEAISNFSWLGLLIGPLIPAWACRIGDATGDSMAKLLTILVGSLFLTVQLPAFVLLAAAWLMTIAMSWRSRKTAALRCLAFSAFPDRSQFV